jgi:hypothetical protein
MLQDANIEDFENGQLKSIHSQINMIVELIKNNARIALQTRYFYILVFVGTE